MASPTIESLCCVSVTSDFSKGFLQDFQSVPYNTVSVVAAACGICGAAFQVCGWKAKYLWNYLFFDHICISIHMYSAFNWLVTAYSINTEERQMEALERFKS